MAEHPIIAPKKLIEVALPLDEVNKACRREKSIRHGHPSTLHLWWARRPLAAARAVLFAQLVNDPSWKYSDEELKKPQIKSAITKKRNELFRLITELVQWENTTNEDVLSRARAEIRASWRETCEANKDHPEAATLFDPEKLPAFHDPFAGGGSIPLEAQRLGLEAHASDLNPVAVLINKAMIEIPPKFAGRAPVGPIPEGEKQTKAKATEDWSGAKGLAEDVRRYGAWMREQAEKRIGGLYPKVMIDAEMARVRKDLKRYEGQSLTVIAWLWARTVVSPNPAMRGAPVPLVTSWALSKKEGREAWIEPTVSGRNYTLRICGRGDAARMPSDVETGTKEGRGATFRCLLSGVPITGEYVKAEAMAGRMGHVLLAIVCEGDRERVYLDPIADHERLALSAKPLWRPDIEYAKNSRHMTPHAYGLGRFGDLFSSRQLVTLTTLTDLVQEVIAKCQDAAGNAGMQVEAAGLDTGGQGAKAYAEGIAVYLGFVIDKLIEALSTICTWSSATKNELVVSTFRRQALPMTWDWAEANPFAESSGSFTKTCCAVARVAESLFAQGIGCSSQADARSSISRSVLPVVSTDPPYYDNVPYADLSDFFYVWLRRSLKAVFPELFATLVVPKAEELVADPFRHSSASNAEAYFLEGMTETLRNIAAFSRPTIPVTVYYAFKQSDTDSSSGTASTGWETFLEACTRSGFSLCGTWPVRTERGGRTRDLGANALASAIVLVFRPRPKGAATVARRDFLRVLERALAPALVVMTSDPIAAIAPVDLQQAAIGPGMAIFSRHEAVLEADGSPMTVHAALVHINKAIDDYFAQAEGELDADTRFCIGWFQQYAFDTGPFGEADVLARAKGTSVDGVREAGVLDSAKGKVRLLRIKEYPADWDPTTDSRTPIWEACHHMCRALGQSEHDAGELLARMPEKQDGIRQLAYRLYTLCERQGRAEEARAYNELITSWPAIVEESQKVGLVWTQPSLLGSEPTPPPKKKSRRK